MGMENGKIWNIFSRTNIFLYNLFTYCLLTHSSYIRYNSYYNVSSNYLPADSTRKALSCLIMDNFFDKHKCYKGTRLDT